MTKHYPCPDYLHQTKTASVVSAGGQGPVIWECLPVTLPARTNDITARTRHSVDPPRARNNRRLEKNSNRTGSARGQILAVPSSEAYVVPLVHGGPGSVSQRTPRGGHDRRLRDGYKASANRRGNNPTKADFPACCRRTVNNKWLFAGICRNFFLILHQLEK